MSRSAEDVNPGVPGGAKWLQIGFNHPHFEREPSTAAGIAAKRWSTLILFCDFVF